MSKMILRNKSVSPEEYLDLEQQSRHKHEFWDGEHYTIAGASLNHNQVMNNIFKALDLGYLRLSNGQMAFWLCARWIVKFH